jgi:asparagine synthase (glutamine-hydrolysing)
MCGIAGILKFDPRERVEEHRLVRMREALSHRGPDGEGLMVDGPVGLAHRRLAIVDVDAGRQPMCNEDGSVFVVHNGEIYNHAQLRPGLEASGHRYRSRCDTETILHAYEEEGPNAVERLQGMFAFAIWDRSHRRLLLARDRLGIKPLYYACTDTELVFASEIKSVLAAGSIRPAFNEHVLPEFLATRFVSTEDTFFNGIRKLLPGHLLSWSPADGIGTRRYWHLSVAASRPAADLHSEVTGLRDRLESAVRSHLMSDVPLGVFLSGGIDSSALAALVAQAIKEPVRTFAVGFLERGANELGFARLAARSIGAEHRDVVVTPRQYFDALPNLVWHEDEPIAFPSSVPLYFVSRLAREHVKVVLTGEGADELFLGYNRYRVTLWNARFGRAYWAIAPRSLRQHVRDFVETLPESIARYARRGFVALEPGYRSLFFENFAVFPEALRSRLLAFHLSSSELDPYVVQARCYEEGVGTMLERMSRVDLQTYLQELLMKQDQMSMASSIESRVPFLDDRLVEHVAAMPGRLKLRGWTTKAVLRAAVRDLVPPTILARRKMGFPVPVGRWLRGGFWPVVEELVLGSRARSRGFFHPHTLRQLADEHRVGRVRHDDRLWLLINLEIWHRIFCEGETPADVLRAIRAKSSRTFYANPLGENGRPLAIDERRPRPQPSDHRGAVPASSSHCHHDTRA